MYPCDLSSWSRESGLCTLRLSTVVGSITKYTVWVLAANQQWELRSLYQWYDYGLPDRWALFWRASSRLETPATWRWGIAIQSRQLDKGAKLSKSPRLDQIGARGMLQRRIQFRMHLGRTTASPQTSRSGSRSETFWTIYFLKTVYSKNILRLK